jgi:hypothetical protein
MHKTKPHLARERKKEPDGKKEREREGERVKRLF